MPVGGATELNDYWKNKFERFFGVKLPKVKIYKTDESMKLAEKYSAKSFTQGVKIYFGKDTPNFESVEGLALLGHELTHVLQQKYLDMSSNKKMIDPSVELERKAGIVEDRIRLRKGIKESSAGYFRRWSVLPWGSYGKYINNRYLQRQAFLSPYTTGSIFNMQYKRVPTKKDIEIGKDIVKYTSIGLAGAFGGPSAAYGMGTIWIGIEQAPTVEKMFTGKLTAKDGFKDAFSLSLSLATAGFVDKLPGGISKDIVSDKILGKTTDTVVDTLFNPNFYKSIEKQRQKGAFGTGLFNSKFIQRKPLNLWSMNERALLSGISFG